MKREAARSSTVGLALTALFTALIAVGAFIRVPIPVIPFTLQTLFVIMAGQLLGPKYAFLSVAVYTLMGLIGIPIFTEGGGIWYVIKPTFGYILGFAAGSAVTGAMVFKSKKVTFTHLFLSGIVGLLIIYAVGVPYFYAISNTVTSTPIGVKTLIISCFLMTIGPDIALCALGSLIAKRLTPITRGLLANER